MDSFFCQKILGYIRLRVRPFNEVFNKYWAANLNLRACVARVQLFKCSQSLFAIRERLRRCFRLINRYYVPMLRVCHLSGLTIRKLCAGIIWGMFYIVSANRCIGCMEALIR